MSTAQYWSSTYTIGEIVKRDNWYTNIPTGHHSFSSHWSRSKEYTNFPNLNVEFQYNAQEPIYHLDCWHL